VLNGRVASADDAKTIKVGTMEQELITLGILFGFALVGGFIAARFKQPTLLGLLIVGAIIGPNALGIIHDEHIMESMIEFGAILMLFVLGLEFDIPKLKKIGLKAITIAALNSALLTFIGFTVSIFLGFSTTAALFIGVILAFGSTVVIVKVLENKGMMNREEVPLLIAILIIEDILAVIIITFFSGIRDKSGGLVGNIETLVISMCLLAVVYILFAKFIKPVLAWVIKTTGGEEIMVFTALGMCAGFAYLAYALKLSPAVGAFLAGSIVASLPNAKQFEHAVAPYNIIISSFFFIAIGTLINFVSIKANIMIILILVLTVIITKITAFSGMMYFFANVRGDKMFFSSMAMFSVGEFSLLVAKESTHFNIGVDLISISAAIVAISAVLMSLTLNFSSKIYEPTKDNIPYTFRKKMEKFATYIKAVSEELDLDNKYSKGLKKNMMKTGIVCICTLLIIFGWKKLSGLLMLDEISGSMIYLGYAITLGIISILLFYLMYMMKKVLRSLSDVFGNAVNIGSSAQSRIVVQRAFTGFTLLGLGLLWPFAMFLFNLPAIVLAASALFFIGAFWNFHKISVMINGNDNNSDFRNDFAYKNDYESVSATTNPTASINEDWEI
jgi:CPA2 family monovalent cation:H+ antiporter-2